MAAKRGNENFPPLSRNFHSVLINARTFSFDGAKNGIFFTRKDLRFLSREVEAELTSEGPEIGYYEFNQTSIIQK